MGSSNPLCSSEGLGNVWLPQTEVHLNHRYIYSDIKFPFLSCGGALLFSEMH